MERERLKELFESMSMDEKIGQLFQVAGAFFSSDTAAMGPMQDMGVSDEDIKLAGSVLGSMGAGNIREIQKTYMEQHPHHIPLIFMLDIINGYKTVYPIPLAQGASFAPELAGKCAAMAAEEGAASGLHVTFSPMADLVRDARWGRVMESTGEDVYLNSLFAEAMVKGYQGENPADGDKLGACVKHFAGYGAAEAGRDYNTAEVSERAFRDFYLPAYEAAVKAGSLLAMTSFNTVDGIPATVNKWLMRDVLRKEMGFDGVLISDFGAIGETIHHGVSKDRADAAKKALEAGCDIDMMSGTYPENIRAMLEDGRLLPEYVEECAWRVLELKNRLGLFENPFKGADEEKEKQVVLSEAHKALAREAAQASFVLLKNEEKIFPLEPGKKAALIGPYADSKYMLGGWSFTGDAKDAVTIKEAAKRQMKGWDVTFCQGCPVLSNDIKLEGFGDYENVITSQEELERMEKEAILAASQADVVVMTLGEHFLQTGEATSRGDINLPQIQQNLFEKIYEVNSNIAVLLFGGRPLDLRFMADKAKAILEVWMPGTMGGPAILDVLTGEKAPSGKLPISFPYCTGQIPVHYDQLPTGRPHSPGKDKDRFVSKYLDIPNKPLYCFGHGLSYTEFDISEIRMDRRDMTEDSVIKASVTVKNTGDREGTETVQFYIHDVTASVSRPVKQLKGFEKVTLKPGQEKKVTFTVKEEMLRFVREDRTFGSEPGIFELYAGNSSETENKTTFELI